MPGTRVPQVDDRWEAKAYSPPSVTPELSAEEGERWGQGVV